MFLAGNRSKLRPPGCIPAFYRKFSRKGTLFSRNRELDPPPPFPTHRFLPLPQAATNPVGIAPRKRAQQGARVGPQLILAQNPTRYK